MPNEAITFPVHHYTEKTLLQTIARTFSIDELSDNIFLLKDVKGFEKDSFYLIKPNEYKCWHRAIAHYDLSEFMHVLMEADLKRIHAKGIVHEPILLSGTI